MFSGSEEPGNEDLIAESLKSHEPAEAEEEEPLVEPQEEIEEVAEPEAPEQEPKRPESNDIEDEDEVLEDPAPAPQAVPSSDRIFGEVEQNAMYPAGEEAMFRFISENLQYPPVCQEQGVQGRVIVSFVVETNGRLTDIKVVRSPDPALSAEAIRVVRLMPYWRPAIQGDKTVRSRFNLPIMFKLN